MKTLNKRINIWLFAFCFLLGYATMLHAQPCSGGTKIGNINPTLAWNTQSCIKGGEYLEFNGVAGTMYTFTFCMAGGLATFDTQISILDAAGVYAGGYADDECFTGSHLAYWNCPSNGVYRVLINEFNCISGTVCATMAYKQELPFGGPGITCGNPWPIPALPYVAGGLSTCGYTNDFNSADACGSTYMDSQDFVLTYSGTAGECISIFTENTFIYTGLFLLDGCPDNPATNCIDFMEGGAGNPYLSNVYLPNTGTYYIVVSSAGAVSCTPFDIEVVNCVSVGVGNNCSNPFVIPALPYDQRGFTTCGFGDDYSSVDACNSPNMNGDDFVFQYTSPGNECIRVELENTSPNAGFFVMDGCPDNPATNCIAQRSELGGNPLLRRIDLAAAGTYYIVVSNNASPQCTPFDIKVSGCPPACNNNPNGTDSCSSATTVSLGATDTVCGFTDMTYNPATSTDLDVEFCGSIENNTWFSFVADSVNMSFGIDVGNCISGFGIQAKVFETSDCINFNSFSNCFNPMIEASGNFQATGLTVGNTYLLMLDGYAGDDCEFSVFRLNGPLPVEFGSFTADAVGTLVTLDWETFSEVNNKGFILERGQLDGRGEADHIDWKQLEFIPGNGNSNQGHQYQTQDEIVFNGNPYFYRINQIDFDGRSTFSDIVSVEVAGPDNSTLLKLFPNPANDKLSISFFADRGGDVTFEIFTLTGQKVLTKGFHAQDAGVFEQEFNLEGLKTGLYIYALRVGGRKINGKIEVIR